MRRISILVPESSVLQAIADPQYLFSTVNQFMTAAGREPVFDVQLVGLKAAVKLNGGLYTVNTNEVLRNIKETDLILIPALFGDLKTAIEQNNEAITWIKAHYEKGAEVASLCLGAFLLASTGLLDGKKCSTHWGFQNQLIEMFPEVQVVEGQILTEESGIYTSGGANSYWRLLLYLVEKYTDRATAILASKYFAVDIDRESQSAFAMFQGQKKHEDEAIIVTQSFIEKNTQEKISVEELANMVSLGRRSFERRFKKATNNTVLEYINRVKIESAKRSFETKQKNVNEVMYDVGYTDTKSFRTVFKKITGLTPKAYKNKYNKLSHAIG